ncbi:MAG: helix-turn-helix domain-containing protein [Planctomycetota bacterium]
MEKIEKELSSKTYRPQPPTRKTEEMDAARAALKAEGWMISKAARRLGCNITTLRRRIERHAELDQEYVQRSPGSGRPSKKSRNP